MRDRPKKTKGRSRAAKKAEKNILPISTKILFKPRLFSLEEIMIKRSEELMIILTEKAKANDQTGKWKIKIDIKLSEVLIKIEKILT